MQQIQPYATFKFIIVGNSLVGKSNILSRYTKNYYDQTIHQTVGIEFSSRRLMIEEKQIELQIWDTAGKEKYKCMTSMFYRGAQGAIAVFSLSDRDSFQQLSKWITEIKDNAAHNAITIIVGNKSDLNQRVIEYQQALEFAKSIDSQYLQVSALQNRNIDAIFQHLLVNVFRNVKNNLIQITKSKIHAVKISRKKSKKKKKKEACC